ncbi:hypothetical protein GWK47_017411 [Chionoecetes opilio]|uniref:FLYWCH-type domain-containing protein n=1 Tax=Chionoecetes opilio TaxID=41210 RepID=A0A8J4XR99_CHIOP|nr:hypothetical protein GWK47_017411 [Chionoecetes opilio]
MYVTVRPELHHSAVSFEDETELQQCEVTEETNPDLEDTKPDLEETLPGLVVDVILQSPTNPTNYKILRGASQRGSDLLLQGGYCYGQDKKLKHGRRWRCTVRNKSIQCKAAVILNGDTIVSNPKPHTCSPKDCAEAIAKIRHHIRNGAKARPEASASVLVKEGLQHLPQDSPIVGLPKMDALIRSTNKMRKKRKPKHPRDLDFEWVEEALPKNFVQEDVRVGVYRHTILFTEVGLLLASQSRTWYVDITFKGVQSPFKQLWGIHAFTAHSDRSVKQVPLIQVLMTRRSIGDYTAVLEAIKERLPAGVNLQSVMMDFEAAVWTAFCRIYPDLQLKGCSFYWTQAVWKEIQLYGLNTNFCKKKNTNKFLGQLLCLPFLPADKIPETFEYLQSLVFPSHPDGLHLLLEYLESTWITSRRGGWTPEQWSVFGWTVRTNIDVEGWHGNLNKLCERAGESVNVYELIEALHKECSLVTENHTLVALGELESYQKECQSLFQTNVLHAWEAYRQEELSPKQLLDKIAEDLYISFE